MILFADLNNCNWTCLNELEVNSGANILTYTLIESMERYILSKRLTIITSMTRGMTLLLEITHENLSERERKK